VVNTPQSIALLITPFIFFLNSEEVFFFTSKFSENVAREPEVQVLKLSRASVHERCFMPFSLHMLGDQPFSPHIDEYSVFCSSLLMKVNDAPNTPTRCSMHVRNTQYALEFGRIIDQRRLNHSKLAR